MTATIEPPAKRTTEATTNGMAYLFSFGLSPGVMKRHRWKNTTGEAITNPP